MSGAVGAACKITVPFNAIFSTQINDTAVLQIPNTTLSDEGVYLCTIVVEEEIVTANFTLKVQCKQ